MRKYLTLSNAIKAILSVVGVVYVINYETSPLWIFLFAMLLVWREPLLSVVVNIGKDERKESDKEAV